MFYRVDTWNRSNKLFYVIYTIFYVPKIIKNEIEIVLEADAFSSWNADNKENERDCNCLRI